MYCFLMDHSNVSVHTCIIICKLYMYMYKCMYVMSDIALCSQIFREAKRLAPSVVYLPRIATWWDIVPGTFHATFMSILLSLPTDTPLFVLATAECPWTDLPGPLRMLFGQVIIFIVLQGNLSLSPSLPPSLSPSLPLSPPSLSVCIYYVYIMIGSVERAYLTHFYNNQKRIL